MAVTIVPGYDFGVNEVPNRETLLRQARFMKLSGIGLDQIDATLVGIKAGTTSGTTSSSLPAPGWMWGDPEGSLWVETDHGPVKLKRAGGGWESVRWGQTFSPQVAIPRSGDAYEPDPAAVGAAQTDGLQLPVGDSGALNMWDMIYVDSDGGCVGGRSAMLCAESVPHALRRIGADHGLIPSPGGPRYYTHARARHADARRLLHAPARRF
jgi:hypothetical protein